MSHDTLETLVNQLELLDRERRRVALRAFQNLSASDRELWKLAKETFDSEEIAAGWFSEPVDSLDGDIPLVLILKGRREDVVYVLGVIQYGHFA